MKKINGFILLSLVLLSASNSKFTALSNLDSISNTSQQISLIGRMIPASTNLTGTPIPSPTSAFPSNLSPGSTVQHRVAVGEWLIQIARCYGADLAAVRSANPQIDDHFSNTDLLPGTYVTIPDIGRLGQIYGPPCVTFYGVQSGDTWTSIAQRFNADVVVLQKVNPVKLSAGEVIKIPLNSANPISFTFQEGPLRDRAILSPQERLKYQFNATKGERLTVELQGTENRIALEISGPPGNVVSLQDLAQTWRVPIPADGTYSISVANAVGNSEATYKLVVQRFPVVSTPVAPTTTAETNETLEQRIAKNTEVIGTSMMAHIAYNIPPEILQLGETLTMELLLNPSIGSEVLASQISESGPFKTTTIQITDQVKAELIQEDDGFIIIPFHDDPEQPIGTTENTKWAWYVTARTPGKHKLTLIIHRLILVGEEKKWIEAGTAYKSEINVTISLGQRILTLDWKWIAGFILALVGSVLGALTWLNNRNKEQKEDETKIVRSTKKSRKEKK